MSILADRFDIAEVKRASVRFKGALQAEWQHEQTQLGQKNADADNGAFAGAARFTINFDAPEADKAVKALPRVDFSLSYKDQTLRGNSSTGFFSPLKVSNWEH